MYPFRFKILLIIIVSLFICVVVRLFHLQIIESDKYKGISKTRRIATYPLEAVRGSIFDRNGKTLALDQHSFNISVQYRHLLYSYVTRNKNPISRISEMRVHQGSQKSCKECHKNEGAWLEKLSRLLDIPQVKLLDYATQVIEKVEKLKQNIEQK